MSGNIFLQFRTGPELPTTSHLYELNATLTFLIGNSQFAETDLKLIALIFMQKITQPIKGEWTF